MRSDWHYDPDSRVSVIFFYVELYVVAALGGFICSHFMSALVVAHDYSRDRNPPAPFLYPPTDWSAMVTLYVVPLLNPAVTLAIMQLAHRLIVAANRRSPLCHRVYSSIVLNSVADLRGRSFLIIWLTLYVVYLGLVSRHSQQIDWYLEPISTGGGVEPLAAEADFRMERVTHPRGFSIKLDNRWAKKSLLPAAPAAIIVDTTCFGIPVGCPIFSLTLLARKPELSGLHSTTLQGLSAWEYVTPEGGERVRCFEYRLVFERQGTWFEVKYWCPNNKIPILMSLPPMIRCCLDTFDYAPQ